MKVLAVVAHSDDEVLGPGPTLAAHAAAGDDVRVFCLCDRGLVDEFRVSCATLGATGERLIQPGDSLDQMFDWWPLRMFIDSIVGVGKQFEPDVVYLHAPTDLNQDHVIAARATMTAFRSAGGIGPTLLAFDTVSSSEWAPDGFQPDWFVPLTKEACDIAVAALAAYPLELRRPPHTRNGAGMKLARGRHGAQCGTMWAQGFKLIRHTCSNVPSPALESLSAEEAERLRAEFEAPHGGHRRRVWQI